MHAELHGSGLSNTVIPPLLYSLGTATHMTLTTVDCMGGLSYASAAQCMCLHLPCQSMAHSGRLVYSETTLHSTPTCLAPKTSK
jgi:hypothetical protein